nr:glycoside hydrolase family 76 protein [uncultured Bacteroides sp.]
MRNLFILGVVFLLISCGSGEEPYTPKPPVKPPVTTDNVKCNQRAKEIFDLVNRYYNLSNGLYKESYPAQSGDPSYSYLWPYSGLVSGAATLTQSGYNVDYTTLCDNFQLYYRNGANGNTIGGYGSASTGTGGQGTRFYDDNSLVGSCLVEAYNITKQQRFLDRASQVVNFLKSGVDNLLDGGIWWNEDEKNILNDGNSNKPTCANGYATLFLLDYYTVCPAAEKASVLSFAKTEYAWIKAHLQDSSDKCYWNDVNTTGAVNKAKWTYNTGVMIQNGVRLYSITGDQTYLNDAIASAQGAYDYFVKSRNNIALTYPDNDPWFNTKLLRAYIDLEPFYKNADSYIQVYYNLINNGYKKARTAEGFFYEDWTGVNPKRYYSLLMQDAVIESYGALSLYKKETLTSQ